MCSGTVCSDLPFIVTLQRTECRAVACRSESSSVAVCEDPHGLVTATSQYVFGSNTSHRLVGVHVLQAIHLRLLYYTAM